jgi:hypothetical protein
LLLLLLLCNIVWSQILWYLQHCGLVFSWCFRYLGCFIHIFWVLFHVLLLFDLIPLLCLLFLILYRFTETEKSILKLTWKHKKSQIAKVILNKKSNARVILQSHSNKIQHSIGTKTDK